MEERQAVEVGEANKKKQRETHTSALSCTYHSGMSPESEAAFFPSYLPVAAAVVVGALAAVLGRSSSMRERPGAHLALAGRGERPMTAIITKSTNVDPIPAKPSFP